MDKTDEHYVKAISESYRIVNLASSSEGMILDRDRWAMLIFDKLARPKKYLDQDIKG